MRSATVNWSKRRRERRRRERDGDPSTDMAVKTISKVGFTPCVAGPREAAGSDPRRWRRQLEQWWWTYGGCAMMKTRTRARSEAAAQGGKEE
jgi:hypothetical protein